VIAKPFDPIGLAATLRAHLPRERVPVRALQARFLERLDRNLDELSNLAGQLRRGGNRNDLLSRMRVVAHGIAGAGGVFGYPDAGTMAAELEAAVTDCLAGAQSVAAVTAALDDLAALAGSLQLTRLS
jgi:chemotaxis protein histidine kinase CheA